MAESTNIGQVKQASPKRFRRWGLLLIAGLLIAGFALSYWMSRQFISALQTDQKRTPVVSATDRLSADQHAEVEAADRPATGEKNPSVVIVEFSDFACTECDATAQTVREIVSEYGTSVRLIYRDFVDPDDAISNRLAKAGKCAHEQGKFWLFHDRYRLHPEANDLASLSALAQNLGLDGPAFNDCIESNKYVDAIEADYLAGRAAQVQGTPTLFFNGYRVEGALNKQDFYDILDLFIPDLNPTKLNITETNSGSLN